MNWLWLDSEPSGASWNMALDSWLGRQSVILERPILRTYEFSEPAVTFGYFQRIADVEALAPNRPLVRRETGGGIVRHEGDWTYSIAVPPSHSWYGLRAAESYFKLGSSLRAAFGDLGLDVILVSAPNEEGPGQCFIGAERSDIVWNGRKIAGAAQRRTKQALLIQGSAQFTPETIHVADWKRAFSNRLGRDDGVRVEVAPAGFVDEAAVRELERERFGNPDYNRKR